MRKIVLLIAIFLTMSFIHLTNAQSGMTPMPRFYSDFKPVIGSWSEYQMTTKGEPPSKMKIAIVGKEGNAYWYETIMESKEEGRTVTKMLVSGNPDERKNIKRMIVKEEDEPAMEIPVAMMGGGAPTRGEEKGKVLNKGSETIKVPAGTFKTQHLQIQGGEMTTDLWVHKDISPYGVVKSESPMVQMVLLRYGTGAKSLITEIPQKLEMPQMPQMPPLGK